MILLCITKMSRHCWWAPAARRGILGRASYFFEDDKIAARTYSMADAAVVSMTIQERT